MAVELAQDLEDFLTLPQSLDVTLAWNFPTIDALATHLAALSTSSQSLSEPQTQQTAISPTEDTDFAGLSEAEVASMLAAELAAVRGR